MVQTHESNERVSLWNHKITLEPLTNTETEYADEVELFASWATLPVSVWTTLFYRHRQRRWLRLLKKTTK
jgi:hypothetical protein